MIKTHNKAKKHILLRSLDSLSVALFEQASPLYQKSHYKVDVLSRIEYKVELVGNVSGSTFEGTYSRKINESSQNTLLGLGGNKNTACIGYYSDKDGEIKVLSKKLKDDFSLRLSPKKT
ncbi:hypothetical protein [Shewanella chilikensis]|uniref:hypothetical protein n=1 Tax=Shewanella chilikensis TaxID=558541 RepID=UPI00300748F7